MASNCQGRDNQMPDVAKYQPQKQMAMTSTTTEILPCQGDSGAKLVGMVDVMDIDPSLKYLKAREFDKKAGNTELWRGDRFTITHVRNEEGPHDEAH